jgi:hypothetical protein
VFNMVEGGRWFGSITLEGGVKSARVASLKISSSSMLGGSVHSEKDLGFWLLSLVDFFSDDFFLYTLHFGNSINFPWQTFQ